MIVLLSPAKTLDYTKEFDVEPTAPAFLSDSAKLIKELKTKEPKDKITPLRERSVIQCEQ